MVAYSFKKQFVPLIVDGSKAQTLRMDRKRHARKGEPVQLYYGMRTKHCRKIIEDRPCTLVLPTTVVVGIGEIGVSLDSDNGFLSDDRLEAFACADGFQSPDAMHEFWLESHGSGAFSMVLIKWLPPVVGSRDQVTGRL